MAVDEAVELLLPLADALDYAHRQGLVHRDLKPGNVLLRPDGSPVLADFGLARAAQPDTAARITATGMLLGTLAYMAPEQFAGGTADPRTDIYALGVLFFEMLTGRVPFDGDSAQVMYGHLQQPPPAPRALIPSLPNAIEQLVLSMLAKDPAQRPQSAAEVAAALRAIRAGPAATGPTIALKRMVAAPTVGFPPTAAVDQVSQPTEPPTRSLERRHLVMLGLIVFGVFAVIVFSGLFLNSPGASRTIEPTSPAVDVRPTSPATTGQPIPTSESGRPLQEVDLERAAEPRLDRVVSSGPEPFSVGNLSIGVIGEALWVFGEVRNDGQESREGVVVRINLLDAAGKELDSQTGVTHMSYLAPGEISSFSVLFSGRIAPPKYASYAVEVRSSKAGFQPGYTIRDLSIGDELRVGKDSFNFLKLSGRVRNTGAAAARYVHVYAVFYDAAGAVVGVADTFAETGEDKTIAPGAEARFEVQALIFTGQPARYRLFAQGSRAD
jgi:serine/threonine-protein kinase